MNERFPYRETAKISLKKETNDFTEYNANTNIICIVYTVP